MRSRPTLLLYCQHSLGIGHLTRSFALATALAERFRVVFLNGGRLPPGVPVPEPIEVVQLPPLGMDDGHTLISRGATGDVDAARLQRRTLIQWATSVLQPAVLLVELFPFGRKKFADEILPMIRLVRRQAKPGLVVCSLRDILVDARPDQQHHDDRARWLADRYFDAVLVHSDPTFSRLQDSFRPRRPLRVPVHHTGCVVPARDVPAARGRGTHVLVSAGGGIVGEPLFHAALDARDRMADPPPMRIVAGPFLPQPAWDALRHRVAGVDGVELLRQVPDLAAEMRTARASISQCGYNSALDIVVSGVPALVVPYETATENEQRERARRLAAVGALQWLPAAELDGGCLADRIKRLLAFRPTPPALDLEGASHSADLLQSMVSARRHEEVACAMA